MCMHWSDWLFLIFTTQREIHISPDNPCQQDPFRNVHHNSITTTFSWFYSHTVNDWMPQALIAQSATITIKTSASSMPVVRNWSSKSRGSTSLISHQVENPIVIHSSTVYQSSQQCCRLLFKAWSGPKIWQLDDSMKKSAIETWTHIGSFIHGLLCKHYGVCSIAGVLTNVSGRGA